MSFVNEYMYTDISYYAKYYSILIETPALIKLTQRYLPMKLITPQTQI